MTVEIFLSSYDCQWVLIKKICVEVGEEKRKEKQKREWEMENREIKKKKKKETD